MIRIASAHRLSLVMLAGCVLTGCGGAPGAQPTASLTPQATSAPTAPTPAYQLSEREQKMNCKQLTGAMRVRILQVRGATTGSNGTFAARTLQSGATKIWGGPGYGSDPNGDLNHDLAQLDAYNRQLAAKKCPTLDLPAELNTSKAVSG